MKNKIYISIICFFIMLVMIIMASYSYFSLDMQVDSELKASVNTSCNTIAFTSITSESLEFSVSSINTSTINASTSSIGGASANITVSMQPANSINTSSCTYDIVWMWTGTDKYETSDVELPYSVTNNSVTTTYNFEFSERVDNETEIDLSSLKWNNHVATIYSGSITNLGQSDLGSLISKTHKIESKIYNIDYSQSNIMGKSFTAKIYISNVNCVVS